MSILSIRIIIHKNNTWARSRQKYPGILGDNWPLWWICLEYCEIFGRYVLTRLLKYKIVLKGIPSSGTRVDPK